MQLYKLYCGRNIPATDQTVSEKEFNQLMTEQTLFEGFTIWNCEGFWLGEKEKTFVIEIATDEENKVFELAKLYRDRFSQQSVMIVKTEDKVNFI